MSNATFLPEDYLNQKAERRTNIISLTLFGIVMIAVVGAFFVTNRQARLLKQQQESINTDYQKAAVQIQELTQLEKQRAEMYNKADLVGALVERVPRSILLAELINRMPDKLALLEFELKSEKVKAPPPPAGEKDAKGRLAANATADKAKTKQQANEAVQKVEPLKYKFIISMVGVAPTDLEVAKYISELKAYELLTDVTLESSEQKEIEGQVRRQFKINMSLDPNADVRRINPLIVPRIKNPMTDQIQLNTPIPVNNRTVTAQPRTSQEGH